jgi:hypothetical protein
VNATVDRVTANPMGDLAEWITIYRRAQSTPSPIPTFAPEPTPPPVVAAPSNPLGTILPTVNMLRNVGVPLGVVAVFLALAAWLSVAAVRHFRSLRKTE